LLGRKTYQKGIRIRVAKRTRMLEVYAARTRCSAKLKRPRRWRRREKTASSGKSANMRRFMWLWRKSATTFGRSEETARNPVSAITAEAAATTTTRKLNGPK
jgi:hypothetical protein